MYFIYTFNNLLISDIHTRSYNHKIEFILNQTDKSNQLIEGIAISNF